MALEPVTESRAADSDDLWREMAAPPMQDPYRKSFDRQACCPPLQQSAKRDVRVDRAGDEAGACQGFAKTVRRCRSRAIACSAGRRRSSSRRRRLASVFIRSARRVTWGVHRRTAQPLPRYSDHFRQRRIPSHQCPADRRFGIAPRAARARAENGSLRVSRCACEDSSRCQRLRIVRIRGRLHDRADGFQGAADVLLAMLVKELLLPVRQPVGRVRSRLLPSTVRHSSASSRRRALAMQGTNILFTSWQAYDRGQPHGAAV